MLYDTRETPKLEFSTETVYHLLFYKTLEICHLHIYGKGRPLYIYNILQMVVYVQKDVILWNSSLKFNLLNFTCFVKLYNYSTKRGDLVSVVEDVKAPVCHFVT